MTNIKDNNKLPVQEGNVNKDKEESRRGKIGEHKQRIRTAIKVKRA